MCGICGFTWNDPESIRLMSGVMAHRGPDQEGVFCDESISLGHRRLSIIDLSENGTQPMYNEDESMVLVYNGEIYNFQQIREELLDKGHVFRSRTDSEVILHAYEEYGIDCLGKFIGMFAFALWDRRKKVLVIARDRLGIKPLYYYHKRGRFAFASEIKALLTLDEVDRSVDLQSMYEYLGFEFVPDPKTMFRDICKLEPGHYLTVTNGSVKTVPFWDLTVEPFKGSRSEAEEELVSLLEDSVKKRLMSDVPLGVFLSGGLDSSAVVALMARHMNQPLRTFTIAYKDPTYSELPYAEKVARIFGTKPNVLVIEGISPEEIETTIWHLDEPMTDLSTIPFYLICKKAREQVIVCLSGEGGDENLVGYDRFKASKIDRFYSILPGVLRTEVIRAIVDRLPDRPQKKGAINLLKRFVEGSCLPAHGGHMRWQYFLTGDHDRSLFLPPARAMISGDPFAPIARVADGKAFRSPLDREVYVDLRFTMPGSVLMKVDKMSMAHSLEVRVPFLDHRFVEFCASLDPSWKLSGLTTKAIFRTAFKGILPEDILWREKQGYSFPSKNWLRDELHDYLTDRLNSSPLIREHFNLDYVNLLIGQHVSRSHNHNHVLWGLLNLAVWHHGVSHASVGVPAQSVRSSM